MILIADSGATKTDWYISKIEKHISTIGLHPFFVSKDNIIEAIVNSEIHQYCEEISSIYFYGAGCGSHDGKELIKTTFCELFPNSEISIFTDLLGAGRSLFGDECGIAAILGTGSNSAVVDKGEIVSNHPSLGFILGDEGSGCYLGKSLIARIYNGLLSEKIVQQFTHEYGLELKDVLFKVYNASFPNRFLASFAEFLFNNIDEPEIRSLVKSGLTDFFEVNLTRYKEIESMPVRFTGSIAFYFSELLHEIGDKLDIVIDKIEKQPMDGLIKYHLADNI